MESLKFSGMNPLYERASAFVSGTYVGNIVLTMIPHSWEDWVKVFLFMLTSVSAGALGVAGNYLFKYVRRKILFAWYNHSKRSSDYAKRHSPKTGKGHTRDF